MSDKFKVRITGAANGVYWYSDKVGEVFQVKASINKGFFTTVGVRMGLLIMASDCEIVEDEMETYKGTGS